MSTTVGKVRHVDARFEATCKACGSRIYHGDEIARSPGHNNKFVHADCVSEYEEYTEDKPEPLELPEVAIKHEETLKTGYRTARKDRVCVKCLGQIQKGDKLYRWFDGPANVDKNGQSRRDWVHENCYPHNSSENGELSDEEMVAEIVQAVKDAVKKEVAGNINEEKVGGIVRAEIAKAAENFDPSEFKEVIAEIVEKLAPRKIEIHKADGAVELKTDEIYHEQFQKVVNLAQLREPIMLVGPTGSGKTHLCEQLAEVLDADFGFASCTAGMSEGQVTGRLIPIGTAGTFEYVPTEFVKIYKNGGVFLWDEIDAADENFLMIINTALANGKLATLNNPDEAFVKMHPDFICIAAANTFGRGADRMYVGRSQLDAATIDRFRIGTVEIEYDEELEKMLCPDSIIRLKLQGWREKVFANRIEQVISTRFISKSYKMVKFEAVDGTKPFSFSDVETALLSGWSKDEIAKVCN